MLRVKIKDKPGCAITRIKSNKQTNLLESIILLDISLKNLKEEYNLSDEQIGSYLALYRKHLKRKEVR